MRRAIRPESVNTAIFCVSRSRAANAAALHNAWLVRPDGGCESLIGGRNASGEIVSAESMIRPIVLTASTGYAPEAVSADNITASVPSQTAFATSDASARVGLGLS